ncbi:MAG: FAD:protein FMN transferase [Candidatus Hydrogenedentes bacterium]|nr:FAD:protein FMN transferase [Candidatus Hydrogenedentota bacterium]
MRGRASVYGICLSVVLTAAYSTVGLCGVSAILAGCDFSASRAPDGVVTFAGATMGTTYSVKIAAESMTVGARQRIEHAISEVLQGIDREMSTWRSDSELSQFNASENAAAFNVSRNLIEVLLCAQRISEQSGGAFDVTVGPLVNAWGFGPAGGRERVPEDGEIARLKPSVGYQKLVIDSGAGALRKTAQGMYVDVAAIAPGYACDKLGVAIETLGYPNYLIELGGEVRARGAKLDGKGWTIGVERPDAPGRALYTPVTLDGMSLSTSGDYREYFEKSGVRYSHTVDPRTGRPITHHLASVTVINRDCMWADAYATAIEVLGPEEGYQLAVREKLPALLLVREAPGVFREKQTPAYTAMFGR